MSGDKQKKYFKHGMRLIFKMLDWLVPKDNNLIIFTQKFSQYSDNSKALYEYICGNTDVNSQWRAVWLYNGEPQRPVSDGYLKLHSPKGFWLALRAKFFTTIDGLSPYDNYRPSKKTKLICLWHGIPIKSIRLCEADIENHKNRLRKLRRSAGKIDLLVCSSKQDRLAMSCAFQVPPQKVMVTGLPRNDNLFKPPVVTGVAQKNSALFLGLSEEILTHKTILYAPTFRDRAKTQELTQFFPFDDFDAEILVSTLKRENAYLLLRPHPADENVLAQLQELVDCSQGYIQLIASDIQKDINELLPFIDVVITDYSSIYVDLLLTNTPCIFVPYDFEHYTQTRSFLYDYDLVTPGPKVSSYKEFMGALNSALLKSAPEYQLERDRVKGFFHQYSDARDGQACQRVLDAMQELV